VTQPFVDVVIACHDPSRPIERAVRSVLASERSRKLVRVTVVAHGIHKDELLARLRGTTGSWRVIEHHDGVKSPAGPFNRGLDEVGADYCMVMGSDDFLDPGAMVAWAEAARESNADMVIAPMRIDDQPMMMNPLPRIWRTRKLDAVRDRLLYRTAPLGLMRTRMVRQLGLRMSDGMPSGEDMEFGVRLFTEAARIDFPFRTPCYVIGTDARERTSHAAVGLDTMLEPLDHLLNSGIPERLSRPQRRALAIKFIRISVLGAARSRSGESAWRPTDVTALRGALERLVAISPEALHPLSRQEREITDAVLRSSSARDIIEGVERSNAMTRRGQRLLPRQFSTWFDRESVLRRYIVQAARERGLG
jgi:hypothetical protein